MDLDIILFGTKGVVCIRHRIKRFNATLKLLLLVSMIGGRSIALENGVMSGSPVHAFQLSVDIGTL
jgi:hypothetical protein